MTPPLQAGPSGHAPPCTQKSPRLARRVGFHALAIAMERKAAQKADATSSVLAAAGKCAGTDLGSTTRATAPAQRKLIAKCAKLGILLNEEDANSFADFRMTVSHSA